MRAATRRKRAKSGYWTKCSQVTTFAPMPEMNPSERTQAVKDALVEALIRLMKDENLDAISVRAIGAEAGINHGLIHRHFGSKEELVRAAARAVSARFFELSPEREMLSHTFALIDADPALVPAVARLCLDGHADRLAAAAPSDAALARAVAPIARALERVGFATSLDPYVANALATAALLGWFTFRPLFETAFGVGPDAHQQVQGLLALLDEITAPEPKGGKAEQ